MQVEEPEWFELQNEQDTEGFAEMLDYFLESKGLPIIVLIVLRNQHLYNAFKNICYKRNVVSQVVSAHTCYKVNLSVASNVLKQMNSKIGGELYTMDFPKEVSDKTMLIGIDVCHQG